MPQIFSNRRSPYNSYPRCSILLVAGPLNHPCNSSVRANSETSPALYLRGKRCRRYSSILILPLSWYFPISRVTYAREYPVTFAIYLPINPLPSFWCLLYRNFLNTSSIHWYFSLVCIPLNSSGWLPSTKHRTCSSVCSFSSIIFSRISQYYANCSYRGSFCIGQEIP